MYVTNSSASYDTTMTAPILYPPYWHIWPDDYCDCDQRCPKCGKLKRWKVTWTTGTSKVPTDSSCEGVH